MIDYEILLRHPAARSPAWSASDRALITLTVIAWLRASRDKQLPVELRLLDVASHPDHVTSAFAAIRNLWEMDEGPPISKDALMVIVQAALKLERSGQLAEWESESDLVFAANLPSPTITLAPYVAHIVTVIGLSENPTTVYVPFENSGQLASRLYNRDVGIWVASTSPRLVQLALINAGVHELKLHPVDPVIDSTALDEKGFTPFGAAVAAFDFKNNYATVKHETELHSQYGHPSAVGPLAAVFHMLTRTTGKVVLVVPDSLLFSPGAERGLRQHLLENRLLDAVLSLPKEAVHGMSGTASILVINTARTSENVLFLKVVPELLGASQGGDSKPHHVLGQFRNRQSGQFSTLVSTADLLASADLNLEPGRHQESRPAKGIHEPHVAIDEHFELIRPRQHHSSLTGVPVHELQASDIPDYGLVQSACKPSQHDLNGPNAQEYFLRENDVVICIKGAVGKVGCIAKPPPIGSGGWVCGQSIAVLRARGQGYNPQALMMYLRSPLGQAQLNRLVVGTSAPTIQGKALKGLEIPVLTPVQSDMAAESLEKEVAIEADILRLRHKQSQISGFLWAD
ncbi:N-6 DNA methylase [Pseudomonas sp. LP_7_YM]|uniref:N-6 DNA methylase n=1 Tax=Pseudomonas sp. LP_7_YM TaxID=2485137 RepID=UPI00105BDA3C|nr:N-6 DNA methylase [Pseudomonas sp. LP_7_YM]TDV58894.1 type I restriction enzyme M protein [Pseudomonas sp. LP_7_YM]